MRLNYKRIRNTMQSNKIVTGFFIFNLINRSKK